MTQDDDLDVMLADGDDTVIVGGVLLVTTVWTHDEAIGPDGNSDGQNMGMRYILLRASLFPDLAQGDVITVNGVDFKAGLVSRTQEGKVLHVWLGVK
jgi:hypothetical protein